MQRLILGHAIDVAGETASKDGCLPAFAQREGQRRRQRQQRRPMVGVDFAIRNATHDLALGPRQDEHEVRISARHDELEARGGDAQSGQRQRLEHVRVAHKERVRRAKVRDPDAIALVATDRGVLGA
eukprot:1116767-Pleurochrysis_carterae.AAC.3